MTKIKSKLVTTGLFIHVFARLSACMEWHGGVGAMYIPVLATRKRFGRIHVLLIAPYISCVSLVQHEHIRTHILLVLGFFLVQHACRFVAVMVL